MCPGGKDASEWFPVNVVMSPWLFNVYMDGVVREVNVGVLGNGLELLSANGGRFEINQLLFADDIALVADLEKLCRLLSEFSKVCKSKATASCNGSLPSPCDNHQSTVGRSERTQCQAKMAA